jgi:predicted cytidylate kinase
MVNAITISGLPGSGTTTVAELLQKKLGWKHVNMGKIFRELAEEHRMKLQEFEEYCEENPQIDREIDKKQEKILMEGNVILESRLAGWIAHIKKIPALKVWIDCEEEERVKRIINREGGDFFEKKKEMKEREESEKRRYKKFYGIDLDDKSIYDVIIDSTNLKPEEIVKKILDELQK